MHRAEDEQNLPKTSRDHILAVSRYLCPYIRFFDSLRSLGGTRTIAGGFFQGDQKGTGEGIKRNRRKHGRLGRGDAETNRESAYVSGESDFGVEVFDMEKGETVRCQRSGVAVSYIKSCDVCGKKISLRQMPGGQWVAFNYQTDDPHNHRSPKKKVTRRKSPKEKSRAREREIVLTPLDPQVSDIPVQANREEGNMSTPKNKSLGCAVLLFALMGMIFFVGYYNF